MTNVAGHLREQNGMYQMILSWKDTDGKRRTKSISTGLPVKGNKKRAESLLRKTQKEFNPETMQQVSDLPVSEYLNRWLRESVMNLPPETYGRYAYDLGRVVVPYFEKKRLSLKALSPRDLETFFRYERQQEEASVQQLLDWHKELTDALQYAVDNNWLKVSPIKEVDPCLDNSPVLFTDFITDWLKMMKSRVEITTYTSYERAIVHKIVPYFEPLHYTLQDMEQHPKYIQDFYQHELDRGLTANTVIHYHANIRKCLQYAFQIGMIRSNPADRVERPRKEKFKSEIYSGEELEQLFKAIQLALQVAHFIKDLLAQLSVIVKAGAAHGVLQLLHALAACFNGQCFLQVLNGLGVLGQLHFQFISRDHSLSSSRSRVYIITIMSPAGCKTHAQRAFSAPPKDTVYTQILH